MFQKWGIVPREKMWWNFLESLVCTRVFRRNVDKSGGTLLNCLESLVGTGRDFVKSVLFQCSEGFGSLSKKPRKSLTTYYNVLPCITKFTSFLI
jgi:hypothetical protein